jgi:outer membrane biosynthesis protein TonB
MQITQRYTQGMNELYNERLKINPRINGRLVIVFYVQSSGLITQTPVIESSSLGDTILEKQCVEYMKTWDYGKCPSRKKTVQIVYPFDFHNNR